MKNHFTMVVLCFLLARAPYIQASEIREVAPEDLSAWIQDRDAAVVMIDGSRIEGRVLMCNQTDTRMRVKRSEPKGRITAKETTVKNQEISTVQIRTSGGRAILGGVVGAWGGAIIGGLLAQAADTDAAIVIPVGAATGGAILGAKLGRRVITIQVKRGSGATLP